ncbi:MAG: nucleotidyltransferase domain-containing protein [Thermoanaerobaculia bacterium]
MKIFSVDRKEVERAVDQWARALKDAHPEIERVIWFGSWIHGRPTPGSDVDICLVLRSSVKPFRDRIPDYLPNRFPTGIDLFPCTAAELERLENESPELHAAIALGREI